jgi:hypothetical protein
MRWRIPLVPLLALFISVACEQQPLDPGGDQVVAEAPTFDFTNNLDNGNIKVYRETQDFLWYWFDDELPLAAIHSTLPLDGLAGGPEPDCGLQAAADPMSYQDVSALKEEALCDNDLHSLLKGTVWITIVDVSSPGTCLGNQLVAEGWGKLINTDNDNCGTGPDQPSTNSWSFKGQGVLMDPEGNKVPYTGMGQHLYSNKKGLRFTHTVRIH